MWRKKRLFAIVWLCTFVASCIYILPQPRVYKAQMTLAPEHGDNEMGGISSIASSFGLNIGGASNDAFYPLIYPDLVASNDFIVSLFDIPVRSMDGETACSLYEYMDKHQEVAYYEKPFLALGRWIGSITNKKDPAMEAMAASSADGKANAFCLSRRQAMIVKKLGKCINCKVDKKTEVFTISVEAQDKLIAAQLADSITARLQSFIIDYRTSKARMDMDYYTKLTEDAKRSYVQQRQAYTGYADSHMAIALPSYQARLEDLENEMQLRYNTYTTMVAQLELAQAKVQERTPAFTIIESATVPVKPAKPKRMLFCLAMLFLATVITVFVQVKKHPEVKD